MCSSESPKVYQAALVLFLLGGALPLLLSALTLELALVSIALLAVVRPVATWLSLAGTEIRGGDRATAAFYGARGIGSVYYLAYALNEYDFTEGRQLWAVVAFVILLSTLVHGLTSGLVLKWLNRRLELIAARGKVRGTG